MLHRGRYCCGRGADFGLRDGRAWLMGHAGKRWRHRPGALALDSIRNQFGQRMQAEDIADAIIYIVTRPRHVAVNEMLIRPTEQER